MYSVLQDWLMELPLRYQGTVLTGIRGCDTAPKPLDTGESTNERGLTAFLRFCVMNPADPREIDIPGAFFQSTPPTRWKPSEFGHYPLHWFSHLMHSFEIVGYHHPDTHNQEEGYKIYERMAHSLHLNIESKPQLRVRMTEDRITNNTVVS